jgi:membrane protein required for colicin V production
MNWLDIVIGLLLVLAAWQGWRQGVIVQVLGLAAIGLGVVLAWRFGHEIGGMFGLEGIAATAAGFAVVLVVVIVAVVLTGRLARGLFRIVGLGVFDNIFGVVFSALKMFALVGLVVMLFDWAEFMPDVISDEVRRGSVLMRAVDAVNGVLFPFVKNVFNSVV